MTSLRHTSTDGYLDAARACILDVGWRRTTLTEVARRAGVSRMTIYRSWSDMATLLGDLMTREWTGIVETALVASDDRLTAGDRLADVITRTVRLLRDNDLFVRIIELDAGLILPYVFSRRGRSQELVLGLSEDAIRAGQATGDIRAGNPTAMARGLLLSAQGFVLSAHTMVDDEASEDEMDAELTTLLTASLRP